MDKPLYKNFDLSVVSKDGEPLRLIASTPDQDASGDIIESWDLSRYLKGGSPLLWFHNLPETLAASGGLPVGSAIETKVEGGRLIHEGVKWASHSFAKDVQAGVENGTIKQLSISFLPIEGQIEALPNGGLRFKRVLQLETSFVPLGCNENALIEGKAARAAILKSLTSKSFALDPERDTPHARQQEEHMSAETAAATAPASITMSPADLDALVSKAAQAAVQAVQASRSTEYSKAVASSASNGAPSMLRYRDGAAEQAETPKEKFFAAMCLGVMRAKAAGAPALEMLAHLGHRDVADHCNKFYSSPVAKTLNVSTLANGAILVPTPQESQIIEQLTAKSVFLAAGPRVIPMTSDTLRLPRDTGGFTVSWVGESAPIQGSTPTMDRISLVAKKLAAMAILTEEFVRDASVDAMAYAESRLIRDMGLKFDLTAFTGTGTDYEPSGLDSLAAAAHVTQQTGTTFANWITDFNKLETALETDNVDMSTAHYFLNPKTKIGLWGLQNAVGVHEFRDEMKKDKTLNGRPFSITSQIAASGSGDRVYFAAMDSCIVGQRQGMVLSVGESYDVSGTTKSAFAQDEVAIKLTSRWDLGISSPNAAAIIHTVTI